MFARIPKEINNLLVVNIFIKIFQYFPLRLIKLFNSSEKKVFSSLFIQCPKIDNFFNQKLKKKNFMDYKAIREKIYRGEIIPENEVVQLLFKAMEIFRMENNVMLLFSPINIVGDIHGQLYDLIEMFKEAEQNKQDPLSGALDPKKKYLFLGDYVDRGYQSLNTLLFLITLKLEKSSNITLLRGNHECRQVNMTYGFHSEIIAYYGNIKIWNLCNDMFDLLPLSALVDGKFFGVHGGISPHAPLVEFISLENRMDEIPQEGLISELCWSDPGTTDQFRPNPRGAGCIFGPSNITAFLRLNNLSKIFRSHQLCQEGFQVFERLKANQTTQQQHKISEDLPNFDDEKIGLVTVWSAPNYAYSNSNKATFFSIDEQKHIEAHFFEKSNDPHRIPQEGCRPSVSYYFA